MTTRAVTAYGLISGLSRTECLELMPGEILDCYVRRRSYDDMMHGIKRE